MKKLTLFWKIVLSIAPIVAIAFFVFGYILYANQKKNIEFSTDERMESQLKDLNNLLHVMVQEKQSKVNSSLNIAEKIFNEMGNITYNKKIEVEAIDQLTNQKKIIKIDDWEINGIKLYQSNHFVDTIQSLTGETATIFQKIDDGYLRISTCVKDNNNKRAICTYIPNSSPVVQAIEKGETYRGRAYVVNDWYLTAYQPIKINGEIKGILYVGVKEMEYTSVKEIFNTNKYFESGYPFMVDNSGIFRIHPTSEGTSAADFKFFKQLRESNGNGKSRYQWPETKDGEWKWQYFTYFEPYQSYISVSVYEDDLFADLKFLKKIISSSTVIAILLVILCIIMVVKPIVREIKIGIEKAKEISDGNLNVSFNLSREDEIGQLFKALNNMTIKLKGIISQIIENSNNLVEASNQLNLGAQSLASANSEQASVSEEVSSSVEQMAATTKQTTANAQETHAISNKTSVNIREGHYSSGHSAEAMRKIASKIQIINDIAFQTNILALNASVEAARAGVHGVGFSVVATEVSKLAARSKDAAHEINILSSEGVTISEKAGKQLAENVPEIEKTTSLIREIAE